VGEARGLQIGGRASRRERRLSELLARQGRNADDPELLETVEDAWLLGNLELSGLGVPWDEVRRSRRESGAPEAVRSLRRAWGAVPRDASIGLDALLAWHGALGGSGFRKGPREREGPPAAPPELIRSRLELLEGWLQTPSARDLRPEPAAALVLARIVEVLPFEDGNGRVSRLAATHVMVSGGRRPPILVAGDRPRLEAALQGAFRFDTAPLASLLEEASERAVDVMIQSLEREAGSGA